MFFPKSLTFLLQRSKSVEEFVQQITLFRLNFKMIMIQVLRSGVLGALPGY